MGNNELQSYIVKKKGKNEYYNLNEWIELYGEYLKVLKLLPQNPYNDPDGNSKELYKELSDFLNEQEKRYIKKEEQYHYKECKKPFGIEVTNSEGEIQFYLKSDQFGFSAPRPEKDHPYDIYLETCSEEDIDRISEWIYYSRTIGGSFLWPTNMMKGSYSANYNIARGGSNPFEDGKYKGGKYKKYPIEDRVDLTLLDIFLYYNNKDYSGKWNKTILCKWFEDEKNEGANKKIANQWFGHFGSFEKYVDFFCFNDFVHEDENNNEKKYMPIDIVNSKLVEEGCKLKGKETISEKEYFENNREVFSIFKKNKDTMEQMFNNVNVLITRRSKTMK